MTFDHAPIREKLHQHVHHLAGQIGPRVLAKPESIEATLAYITSQWIEMGFEVRRETYESAD